MSNVPPPPPGQQPPPPSPSGAAVPPPPVGNMAPPPGYVSYGTAPTPTNRVRRIGGLSKAITILVAIAGLGGILNLFATSALRNNAQDLLDGRISTQDFTDELASSSALSAVGGIATLAAMVVVMIWMYRITSNLKAYGMQTTWHPLFAIFGWFLPPGVLYVIPFLMLREQWSKSSRSAIPGQGLTNGDDDPSGSGENPVLWVWWLAFGIFPLIALVFSGPALFGNLFETDANAIAESVVDSSLTATIVSTVVNLVAAAAWIVFVRQLTARHRNLTGEQ